MLRHIQEQSLFGYALVVIIFAAILGAIMSTADSTLLSMSSMVTKDLYMGFVRPHASQATLTSLGKWISTVFVVVLAALAVWLNNSGTKLTLVELLEMKFDMLLQLAPAFMIAIHWQRMRAGPVFAGMFAGLVFALLFFPPALSPAALVLWATAMLMLTYAGYSALSVAQFQTKATPEERARLAARFQRA